MVIISALKPVLGLMMIAAAAGGAVSSQLVASCSPLLTVLKSCQGVRAPAIKP